MTRGPRSVVALAALFLAAAAGAQDAARSYRYFYEDVFEPFFVLDGAHGVYRPARDGAASRSFEAVKPRGTFRVFLIGGSIARLYGEEDLSATLSTLMPGRGVEVIDCGMSGYDSPRERIVLEEVLGYSPDAVVLMSGHNDSIERPWVPRWKLEAARWGRRLGAVPAPAPPPRRGAARARAVADGLRAFEENVRAMVRASAEREVPIVVLLPPLNVRDEPSRWVLPRADWFREGWTRYLEGDCAGARRSWARGAGAAAPEESLAAFFSARCLEAEGRSAAAAAAYERALALDEPLLGRCGPDCRASLLRAAALPGAFVADADREFRAYAAPELPGFDEFADGVHWRPELHRLVTRAVVDALRRSPAGPGLSPDALAAPSRPAPRRSDEEWSSLLRAATTETPVTGELSAVLVAALQYAASRRGGLDSPAEIARLESGSNALGASWGMAPLAVPRAEYEWSLADALLTLGRVAPAGAAFEAATRAGARSKEFVADRASYFLRAGDPERAAREASGDAGWILAHPDAARRHARRLEAENDADSRARAVFVYERLGDAAAAARARCRAPYPSPDAEASCARELLTAGERAAAIAAAAEALSASGAGAETRRSAALVLQDAGRAAQALAAFAAAAAAAPGDAVAAQDYGVALFGAGRKVEAIATLRRAARLEAEPGDAALSLAAALDSVGRGAEAESVLRAARARARGRAASRFDAALSERPSGAR